jgi:2-C-methyl-D-erythritol 4-phosphate cytidylyltransferase/2-C-methyl-D-erythritol 2,4-cyclodiphosphate synthase
MNEAPSTVADSSFADVAIIIVAAGRGLRAGGDLPKQYRALAGRPLIAHTIDNLGKAAPGATLVPVIHPDDAGLFAAATADLAATTAGPAFGGATRQASVRAGLRLISDLAKTTKIVLIHDGARLFVETTLIQRAIACARTHGAGAPGLPVSDTIKQVDAAGAIVGTPVRANLRAVQTPQAFDFHLIADAHARAAAAGIDDMTDDAAVAEWAGATVHVFEGDARNMKVTEPGDFARAEARLMGDLADLRVGQGYDVHAFAPGDHLWLGGVRIAHERGLDGHSDADVLMHAITDAILGALADGDIGSHFPPSDPRWKGAASDIFLRHAAGLVRARGGVIAHVDGTVVCEAPKVGPHRDAIRARLADILGLPADRVAVKATTSEKLGFTGRREGVAALATATIRLPYASPDA